MPVRLQLDVVLAPQSAARRERAQVVAELEKLISNSSRDNVTERVAYTWFNRFCALRFMDVNRYTRIGVVSPAEGQFQPEILAEAKMGHIDEEMVPSQIRQKVLDLLAGRAPSTDSQGEAYRLLVVAACNAWNQSMDFLFERIDDYTELLMPDDLLSGNSILAYTREAMTPDACKDVEVIGWLYQFYISEKKDAVFEGLKKNQKITPENIPAATQLFTPHWIVRYLVDNSLGRLWLLNRPNSRLEEQMEYYIPPEKPESDFLKITGPEDIKVCDPACGSGHMLTYAFDLLYAMYEEEGYDPADIPEKILTHNLFGIELDERAGELAAFALTMKARARQRRFFNKGVKPNICVLEKVSFSREELDEYMGFVGRDLFTYGLRETLQQFSEVDNFGSLIVPKVANVTDVMATLESKDMSSNLFLAETHKKVLTVLRMADALSPRYAVVVANPPYMGGKGMNPRLSTWAKENFPSSKSDLFAMFIERGFDLTPKFGYSAMVTMQSWMFLSSYEALRERILSETSIECMVHMANMVMGIAFGTSATVLKKGDLPKLGGPTAMSNMRTLGKTISRLNFHREMSEISRRHRGRGLHDYQPAAPEVHCLHRSGDRLLAWHQHRHW
ncbi:BREX-1 system adenine-specific DNA-methyltransferase PglX [Pseudomonas aeruginosa]|uniref:BREX-1 system adenine-specific DNA-methyltransferase PglX n=1 Tax=Pseudomonas aeruginosa TaxID=287 RepID=UPI0030F0B3D9